jgi:phosphopentomutase|tara:strand:- start:2413 stop:3618 length:1206 start_codon:yes stop_codon:yes gene_type:complete
MGRAIILVADGFGIGSAPDAKAFGDAGANTFAHVAQSFQQRTGEPLSLPNLAGLGLVAATKAISNDVFSLQDETPLSGAYGAAAQISTGKDTPSGHWEMTGVPVMYDWGYYPKTPECFPRSLMEELTRLTGIPGTLGRCHASGTDIIRDLGEEHMRTGRPICYTSADSVFQVAAHENSFGLDRLYAFCEAARELLYDANIGRVIARPFIGLTASDFKRTGNRRDYSFEPHNPTLLDVMTEHQMNVEAVGKISDIFAHRGITTSTKATGLPALIDATIEKIKQKSNNTLIFTNLVNFDQDFGHRRDPVGYAEALAYFDQRLEDIMAAMTEQDLLIITADHGCDPTWVGSDHTREYVPILAYRQGMESVDLGPRTSFSDIGQTLAGFFEVPPLTNGESFLDLL